MVNPLGFDNLNFRYLTNNCAVFELIQELKLVQMIESQKDRKVRQIENYYKQTKVLMQTNVCRQVTYLVRFCHFMGQFQKTKVLIVDGCLHRQMSASTNVCLYKCPHRQMSAQMNVCLDKCPLRRMSTQTNICLDKCLLRQISAQTNVCFDKYPLRRMSAQTNVCLDECLHRQMSAQMNVCLDECLLR